MNTLSEKNAFYFDLENMKRKIESMSKNHQIEILKILKKHQDVKINENKSGVFINLTFLPENTLNEMRDYLNYVHDQENSLSEFESQKKEFKDAFFDNSDVDAA